MTSGSLSMFFTKLSLQFKHRGQQVNPFLSTLHEEFGFVGNPRLAATHLRRQV